MIWFGWFLWHINHCRLFNAKSTVHIYIKYIWFGLVGFYGISTIVGYLMPNPLYTYISYIWFGLVVFLWHINHCRLFNAKSFFMHIHKIYDYPNTFRRSHFQRAWVCCFFFNPIKAFHLFLIWMILHPINHCLHTISCFQAFLCITNNSIKHQSCFLHPVKWLKSSISSNSV